MREDRPIKNSALRVAAQYRENGIPQDDLEFETNIGRNLVVDEARIFSFSWNQAVLVLGRSQTPAAVDADLCEANAIPILKRKTGGTGVLHEKTLNIGLTLPASQPIARRVQPLYDLFTGAIKDTLSQFGVSTTKPGPDQAAPKNERSPMCFADFHTETLLYNDAKVLGCAQWRTKGSVLVHGTLNLSVNHQLQARVFRMSEEQAKAVLGVLPASVPPPDQLAEAVSNRIVQRLEQSSSNPVKVHRSD